jgi:hypothetical protein
LVAKLRGKIMAFEGVKHGKYKLLKHVKRKSRAYGSDWALLRVFRAVKRLWFLKFFLAADILRKLWFSGLQFGVEELEKSGWIKIYRKIIRWDVWELRTNDKSKKTKHGSCLHGYEHNSGTVPDVVLWVCSLVRGGCARFLSEDFRV